jgi:Flp pilus assembly protein TadD
MDLGDTAGAEASVRKALELTPDHPDARHNLARLLWNAGKKQEAIAEARRAIAGEPNDPRHTNLLGQCLFRNADKEGAKAAFERAIELDPVDAEQRFWLGATLRLLGSPDAARQQLEHALRLDPKHAKSASELAVLALTDGDLVAARALLLRAIASDPKLQPAHGNFLYVCEATHDDVAFLDEALRWLALFPDDPNALADHAAALLREQIPAERRDPAAALASIRRAIEHASEPSPGMQLALADALFATGDRAGAIAAAKRVIAATKAPADEDLSATQDSARQALRRYERAK